jgi:hypothetical protein
MHNEEENNLKDAMRKAIHELSEDRELRRQVWKGVYSDVAEWVGARLLTAIIAAALTAGVVLLIKQGVFK